MSKINKIPIKRGDTFAFYANITIDGTTPLVTEVENIRSQIRTAVGALVADLTITTTANLGEYLFKSTTTEDWAIGTHQMDIEINIDGFISSSDTIFVEVSKDVTRA